MSGYGISFVFRPRRRVGGKLRVAKNFSAKLRMPWEERVQVFTLGTSDRRVAESLLADKVRERHQERQGLLPPASVREAAQRSLGELLAEYLQDLRARGRAQTTLDKYESNLRTLFAACGWQKLRSVTARDFSRWRSSCGLAPKSLNDILANARGFFAWLRRQGLATENPLECVGRVDSRLTPRFRRALSTEEQGRLLRAAPPFRRVIYLLILETGMRRNELQNLKVGDLELDTPAPFVRLPASITKNRKPAVMRLRPHVVRALRTVLPDHALPCEWIFHNRVPRTSTIVRDLKRAGIAFATEHGRVDLHALRVTFCTNLLNAGVHPRVAQELMRHSDIKLTMRNYTDASQLPVAAALEKLPVLSVENDTQKDTHERPPLVLVGSSECTPEHAETKLAISGL